ncbi:MAG: diacylglycerol kinase family protein [Bacilli bacterium]|nr:diacylglycerol kinase family protein [Bacilli bacterium]
MVLKGRRYKHEKKTVIGTLKNALNGINYTFTSEINFKIHLLMALIVVLASYILEVRVYELLLCILLIGLVLAFEVMNTVIEMVVDMVMPKYSPLAGMIKDASSGAVLLMAVTSALIGLVIFIPKIIVYFGW